jgi:flavodoxin
MKTIVISYSLTGNNSDLAKSVAGGFAAEHIKITEPKPRTMGTIVLDMIFKRTPKVQPIPNSLSNYDLILFFGPVWIGQVATPLRAYLKQLQKNPCPYAFISISGGADGPNLKLEGELQKRAGQKPIAVIDLHIADLLPIEPKPTRKVTSAYRVNSGEIKKLTDTIMKTMRVTISN